MKNYFLLLQFSVMTVWDLILHLNSWCLSTLLIIGYVSPSSEIKALFNISAVAVLGTLPSEMLQHAALLEAHFSLRFDQYSTHLPSSQLLSLDFCSDLHYIKKKTKCNHFRQSSCWACLRHKRRKCTALHTALTDESIILRLHHFPSRPCAHCMVASFRSLLLSLYIHTVQVTVEGGAWHERLL